jgi:serine/threonine protein kinase
MKDNSIFTGSFGTVFTNIKSKNNRQLNNIVFKIIKKESDENEFKALIFHYLLQKYYYNNKESNLKYLCTLYEFGNFSFEDKIYAIMENCGIDLFYYLGDIMNSNKNLSNKNKFKKLLILFNECCEGVKLIHDLGYLHLDIKPENFMITNDGNIKIIDFGLVKNVVFGLKKFLVHQIIYQKIG